MTPEEFRHARMQLLRVMLLIRIAEENLVRNVWKLDRIIQVYRDGRRNGADEVYLQSLWGAVAVAMSENGENLRRLDEMKEFVCESLDALKQKASLYEGSAVC